LLDILSKQKARLREGSESDAMIHCDDGLIILTDSSAVAANRMPAFAEASAGEGVFLNGIYRLTKNVGS
jgi:hypothetical protein